MFDNIELTNQEASFRRSRGDRLWRTLRLWGLLALFLAAPAVAHAHASSPMHGSSLAGPAADPVVIVGTVEDRADGRPLAAVQLRFRQGRDESWIGAEVLTDEDGNYRTPALEPGQYQVRVQLVGYTTLESVVEVAGASPMTIDVQLSREAVELESIAVVARRNAYLERSGFYERQRAGLGLVYDRSDLEGRGFSEVTDLFRTIAGVELRASESILSPYIWFRRMGCRPDIVLDGTNYGPDTRVNDYLTMQQVEGIEVYRGASTNPATLSSSNCGSVVIWTMSDDFEDGERFGWARVVIGVVVVGLVQLLRP